MYIHIFFHLKVSDDLEVYEIDQPSKDKLEEICDFRQPLIFDYEQSKEFIDTCNLVSIMDNYGAFDIQLRNIYTNDNNTELYLPFILNETVELFKNDEEGKYITENNSTFLEETALIKIYKHNDAFLRPQMVSKCMYDIISASKNTCTKLQYNLNYRNYFLVTQGHIRIKLIPPHYSKYLYEEKDYLNFIFTSPIQVWNIENQPEYKNDYNKVKSMDIELKEGQIIYIPAYWWYSIKFETISSISTFFYRTYMNTCAISPQLFILGLQKMNVKREVVNKHNQEKDENNKNIQT